MSYRCISLDFTSASRANYGGVYAFKHGTDYYGILLKPGVPSNSSYISQSHPSGSPFMAELYTTYSNPNGKWVYVSDYSSGGSSYLSANGSAGVYMATGEDSGVTAARAALVGTYAHDFYTTWVGGTNYDLGSNEYYRTTAVYSNYSTTSVTTSSVKKYRVSGSFTTQAIIIGEYTTAEIEGYDWTISNSSYYGCYVWAKPNDGSEIWSHIGDVAANGALTVELSVISGRVALVSQGSSHWHYVA